MPTLIMPKEAAVRKFHPAVWCAAIVLAGLVTRTGRWAQRQAEGPWNVAAVAHETAPRHRWEFLLTAASVPVLGGTGFPLNPIATF